MTMDTGQSPKSFFYSLGRISAILIVIMIPLQIVCFLLWPHPTTIEGWFSVFNNNWIIGLIGFDFLYMLSNLLMIPLFLSIFISLYETNRGVTILALAISLIGLTIYFSSNASFEMLQASRMYKIAVTEQEKQILISAGQTFLLIYKGTAYAVSYVLGGISLILFFSVMLKNDSFRKVTGRFGLASGILMLVPATAGVIGMSMALLSLIPWSIFCILLAIDYRRLLNESSQFPITRSKNA